MANTRIIVHENGSLLIEETAEKSAITDSKEVVIRLKAIAINPADCEMIDQGQRVSSWPFVPGLDASGVVEAVGDEVKNVAVGDEVLALFTAGDRSGSYQKYAVVKENMVAKNPVSWSFEEAATLGVCYLTALISLGVGLKIALPFVKDGPKSDFEPSSVLIVGGSSAVGAAAIQLLRIAIPECTILVTSSPKHHDHLVSLGANEAFDRNSSSLVEDVKETTLGFRGVDAIIDTVGAGATERNIFMALNANGPKRYAQVWTGDEEIEVPDGVESVLFRSRDVSQMPGGSNVMAALQDLLDGEKYKLPLPVRKVGNGFEGLNIGLDLMRKGVSGEKLVVSL